jgi:hypothetical protein
LISFVRWLRSENFLIHSSRNKTKKKGVETFITLGSGPFPNPDSPPSVGLPRNARKGFYPNLLPKSWCPPVLSALLSLSVYLKKQENIECSPFKSKKSRVFFIL